MKIIGKYILIVICALFLTSCQTRLDKVQGVYSADKESLKETAQEKMGNDNLFASALASKILDNAVIEFKITGDSVIGLLFFAGQSNVLKSKIIFSNDSLMINVDKDSTYLIPNNKGILFRKKGSSEAGIQMIKLNQANLSTDTESAMLAAVLKDKEQREFEESLGQWKRGNFVDEFGDQTGREFPFTIVRGSHESSVVISEDVFVKTVIEKDGLYFQVFNSSMTIKENFPDNKFGFIRIKFPNGDVKSEKVFFYQNIVLESSTTNAALIFNHLTQNEGELKILIDVSTASDYYSDKYQFTLQKANLGEVMKTK